VPGVGDLSDIEAAARGAALALLALWSWILLRRDSATPAARMAVLLCVSVACHLMAIMPEASTGLPPLDLAIEIGSGAVPGCFWLFARAWFDDQRENDWRAFALVGASALLPVVHLAVLESAYDYRYVTGIAFRLSMLGFAVAGMYIAWRGRADDLVEVRRRLRSRLVWAVGAYVILVNVVEVAIYEYGAPYALRALLVIGIGLLVFAVCAAMLGPRSGDLFATPQRERERDGGSDPDAAVLATRLDALMAAEKPHRDETLSIGALAARLDLPEHRLRRLINGHLGHRNFAAYLNGFRLAEVKAALADPTQRDVPILTIALDAGFGSLAPFNRAFRDAEGMTPTEYRQRHG
jgi:AraC-like DNA-binding protein